MLNDLFEIINHPLVIKILVALIGIIIIGFVIKFIQTYSTRQIKAPKERYHRRKLITYIGYFIIFLFLLVVFYERLRGLTIAFGLIGAGVAFSLQRVIASIAGWIALLTQHFYKIGDRIEISGIRGDVVDINVLRTAIMEIGEWIDADLYTGRIVWISNGMLFDTPIYNYSGYFPYVWDQIKIPVKYSSDPIMAKEILKNVTNDIVKDYINDAREAWQLVRRNFVVKEARIEPFISLATNDNWMEFTTRYVVHYDKRVVIKDELFTRILQEFNKTEGKVGFASQTFQIVGVPPVNVNFKNPS